MPPAKRKPRYAKFMVKKINAQLGRFKKKKTKSKRIVRKRAMRKKKMINKMLGLVAEKIQRQVPYEVEEYAAGFLPLTYTVPLTINDYTGHILWNTDYLPAGAANDKIFLRYLICRIRIVQGVSASIPGQFHYYEQDQKLRIVIIEQSERDIGATFLNYLADQSIFDMVNTRVKMLKLDKSRINGRVIYDKTFSPKPKPPDPVYYKTVPESQANAQNNNYIYRHLTNYRIPIRVFKNIDRTKPTEQLLQYRIFVIHDPCACSNLASTLEPAVPWQVRNVPYMTMDLTTWEISTDV